MAKQKPPVSIQLYTLRKEAEKDLLGTLKEVAASGYVGVEMAGLYGKKPAEVRKMLDDLGLVASSAHVGLPTAENLKETVETANALGYKMIITQPGAGQVQGAGRREDRGGGASEGRRAAETARDAVRLS